MRMGTDFVVEVCANSPTSSSVAQRAPPYSSPLIFLASSLAPLQSYFDIVTSAMAANAAQKKPMVRWSR